MRKLEITTTLLLPMLLAVVAFGCSESDETETDGEDVRLPFGCPSRAEAYRDFITARGDYALRDELEQIALSHFDSSCLTDCELTGDMTACRSGSCATVDGGTVEYELVSTWSPADYDPSEGHEVTQLTILIENPEGAALRSFELNAETLFARGVEDLFYGLDLTLSWAGSIGEGFPEEGSLAYEYTGRTFESCFYSQVISSEIDGCRFEAEVREEADMSCDETCDFIVTPEGGGEMIATGACPPYSLE